VTDLGIAELAVRQTHRTPGRLQGTVRKEAK
jgi:hypothetical protein